MANLRALSPVRREVPKQTDETLEDLVFHHVREEVIDFSVPSRKKRM